jgi:hypothetical protein
MPWAKFLGAIWDALKWAWPTIRSVLVWAGILAAHTVLVETLWESVFNDIDSMVTGYTRETINFAPLSLINSFFPLSESLTILAAYFALILTSNSIRISKAFIDSKKA